MSTWQAASTNQVKKTIQKAWEVHTFEGKACCTEQGLQQIRSIVTQNTDAPVLTVVAPSWNIEEKITELVELAVTRQEKLWANLESLKQEQTRLVDTLIAQEYRKEPEAGLKQDLLHMEEVLHTIWLVRECSPVTRQYLYSLSAVWTGRLIRASLCSYGRQVIFINSGDLITVCFNESGPDICWDLSARKLKQELKNLVPAGGTVKDASAVVTTGGLCTTTEGISASLGKDGTEFTASILANLLDAASITNWTDVEGVMSADPQKVPAAVVVPELSYQEATELAYFGAKVLHPPTMMPAIIKKIPIYIKNIYNPKASGTCIKDVATHPDTKPVKGFSIVDSIALLNIEGAGMIGVPGISSRLFSALKSNNISVILISQASSEHSICCAVPQAQAELAQKTAANTFAPELDAYKISSIEIDPGCSILAAVGDNMSGIPGISAKFFGALGKAGVNVRAIAQGSSERNISAVIAEEESTRALRAVHAGFYLSSQTLSIGIIGPGLIGRTLIEQIAGESERLKNEFNIDLRVRAICNSRQMFLQEDGIDLNIWKDNFDAQAQPIDIEQMVDFVNADHFPHKLLVDCTTSEIIPAYYIGWLKKGIHIVTPNKKGCTGSMNMYRELMATGRTQLRHFLYETTVGAGLPIIGTLRDLIQTGDNIIKIEGVFSGTLAFLFWKYDGTTPFSDLVKEARELGYTEPDPRDDLSGMDIVRKTVILAREIGLEVEVENVPVKGLVPAELTDVSVDEFLARLSILDEDLFKMYRQAAGKECVLKYVGVIDEQGSCRVELKEYAKDHPFARITGTDNIAAFTTARYSDQPLVVQGPGAGPHVTAGGVFADILRLAAYLGARI